MESKQIKEIIAEQNPEALFIDGLDGDKDTFNDALIGFGERCGMETVAIYDMEDIISIISDTSDIGYEEAEEWYNFNIAGAYMGPNTPIFVCDIRKPII